MKGEKEETKKQRKESVPTMESFPEKERDEKLDQLYKNLQHHWDEIKQSNISSSDATNSNTNIILEKAIQLMNTSPRDLMSTLQQHSSFPQAWNLRTKDLAVQEIIRERRAAIETGRLKGRRLFEPTERGTTVVNDGLSTDMGQESEVRSLSSDYSEDETHSFSSSSSPCLTCDSVDKDQVVREAEAEDVCKVVTLTMVAEETRASGGRPGNGGRYIVFQGVIAIALLMLAMYMRWARSFDDHQVILVPT